MSEAERRIYVDHAATTPLDRSVLERMQPFFRDEYGNPSSLHRHGRAALEAIEGAREKVARALGAAPHEIIFTSGGTESNDLAITGMALALRDRGRHIITSRIEHHCVLRACARLREYFGVDVTYVDVDERGQVSPQAVEREIRPDTVLISIMYANNEVGAVQPVSEIARIARSQGILFHSDGVQAAGALSLNVAELGVQALAFSAHKFYGPKGVGGLYLHESAPIAAVHAGGSQEAGRRAGTENVPGIVGLAEALRIAEKTREAESARQAALRDRLLRELPASAAGLRATGDRCQRLPNHASFVIDGADGETIVLGLDAVGISASTGAACSARAEAPSHVLRAMGYPERAARGSVRFTVGRDTSDEDIDYVIEMFTGIVEEARRIHRFDGR